MTSIIYLNYLVSRASIKITGARTSILFNINKELEKRILEKRILEERKTGRKNTRNFASNKKRKIFQKNKCSTKKIFLNFRNTIFIK